MTASITLHENEKNNWTVIVEGGNREGIRYHNKKVKHRGTADSAIRQAVKVLNLGDYTVTVNDLTAQKSKNTMIAQLGRKLADIKDLDISVQNESCIVINFWDSNTIDLDKKRQVFIGKIVELNSQLNITITMINAVYSDDLMDHKERNETESTFNLTSETLFTEIEQSEVSPFLHAAVRCQELMTLRLKAMKCK
ncbi:hypothetical protein ACT4XR_19985 (plasmid) [Acinetobacter baumannii]|uniref:hypothetical protein n=1 Tax=Acinetobacter baumannii TaxID=470 RepID=UPI003892A515